MSLRPVKLYESSIPSGNAYKVLLTAAHLGLALDVERLDILRSPSQTRTPEFLLRNPNGRIPVLELSDGSTLCESNAIVVYLAEGSSLLPDDKLSRARALQWMFFEQYSHERFIAVLKFWQCYGGGLEVCDPRDVSSWRRNGQAALEVMNHHLAGSEYFSGNRFGVADIALYAYSHTAELCGYELESLPFVRRWLSAVAAQPSHIPMWSPSEV